MQPTAAPAQTSDQALQSVQQFQQGMQTPDQVLAAEQGKLGVSQAQQQVSGLRTAITNTTNLLNQVAPSVMGRTQNSLVTSAQAEKQVANESAPISGELSKESQDYNTANANYTDLQSQAENATNATLASQNNQLSTLQGIYQDLFTKEQAAQQAATQKQEFDQQQAEAQREFDANLRATTGGGGLNLGGGNNGVTTTGAGSIGLPNFRVPGDPTQGFAFTDSKGNPANALQYAQAHNIPFYTLLQQMASKGDVGAKTGLTFIGNNGNADPTKVTSKALADLYHALTGRSVAVYNPNSKKATNPITTFTPSTVFGIANRGSIALAR